MSVLRLHQVLADETRLRIVHLLLRGPLCVCHLQELLDASQVNISRHLARLKAEGLVVVRRHRNWRIYRLPTRPSAPLQAHLRVLAQFAATEPILLHDLARREKWNIPSDFRAAGCSPASRVKTARAKKP